MVHSPEAAPQMQTPLSADIGAGIVVSLVALPLCLGIALASGAPLVSGLVAGVIGGIVISSIGRANLLVSGPAAGLAAIVLAALAELGSFHALLAATVVAGALQIGLGLLKSGRFAALVPSSVVTGMLAAIGVLLVLQQFPSLIGAPREAAHGLEILLIPFNALPHASLAPAIAGLVTLLVVSLWPSTPAALRKLVPGPLAAVLAGTLAAEGLMLWGMPLSAGQRVDLPEIGGGLQSLLAVPDWSALSSAATWRIAVTLAVVASLETLLSLEATDRMDPLKRKSNPDRELVAQGVGNALSGLFGGLPITGVIVRSAANVSAGGLTWRASLVHGVILAFAVLAIPSLLERIPLAALAAILVHTGLKLAHPLHFKTAYRIGPNYLWPLLATVVGVVVTDLLIGVALGLATAAVFALRSASHHGIDVIEESRGERPVVRVALSPTVSFLHKARLRELLESTPPGTDLTIDASQARKLDHDVAEMVHRFSETARERQIEYQLVGVTPVQPTAH